LLLVRRLQLLNLLLGSIVLLLLELMQLLQLLWR